MLLTLRKSAGVYFPRQCSPETSISPDTSVFLNPLVTSDSVGEVCAAHILGLKLGFQHHQKSVAVVSKDKEDLFCAKSNTDSCSI